LKAAALFLQALFTFLTAGGTRLYVQTIDKQPQQKYN